MTLLSDELYNKDVDDGYFTFFADGSIGVCIDINEGSTSITFDLIPTEVATLYRAMKEYYEKEEPCE